MTDYEEMVLMQHPFVADSFPRNLTPQEVRDRVHQQALREAEHDKKEYWKHAALTQEGLQNTLRASKARKIPRPTTQERQAAKVNLHTILKNQPATPQNGGYLSDSNSARVTQADTLWPSGSALFEDATGASPLPLPAPQLPMIGIWDRGGVTTSSTLNTGLLGRVTLGNTPSELLNEIRLLNDPHTTEISKILGNEDLTNATQGLAYQSHLKIYSDTHDFPEMIQEAANGMTFSNHSYSPGAGWQFDPFGNAVWWGPASAGPTAEDPEFGSYTQKSRTIDSIIYTARTYLPVFTSSNDANDGAPVGLGDPSFTYSLVTLGPDPNDPTVLVQTITPGHTALHPPDAGIPDSDPSTPTPEDVHEVLEMDNDIGNGIGLGLDTIKSTGSSKNNLTVGAAYTDEAGLNLSAPNIGLSHFSSRGPIDDGRVKPDLVGPSTFEPIGPGDIDRGATSWAAPAVTGTLALLQEINFDSEGPNYLASTWKALLLNTATDCTQLTYLLERLQENSATEYETVRVPSHLGAAADSTNLVGPDYFFGWGMVNANAAAQLLVDNLRSGSGTAHICEHTLIDPSNNLDNSDNITIEIPFEHDGLSPEIRAMICWTDPPYQSASPLALDVGNFDPENDPADDPTHPKNLVNDLDLWIVDPNGKVHRPWVLDPLNPLTPATRVVAATEDPAAQTPPPTNLLDNVEQIVIENPIAGTYTLKVSHKGTLISTNLVSNTDQYQQTTGQSQDFSLVISGNLDPEPIQPRIKLISRVNQGNGEYLTFTFHGFVGVTYQLEESQDLLTWAPAITYASQVFPPVITSDQAPLPLTFYRFPRDEKRYYRIKKDGP